MAALAHRALIDAGADDVTLDEEFPESPSVIARVKGTQPGRTIQWHGHLDAIATPQGPVRREGDDAARSRCLRHEGCARGRGGGGQAAPRRGLPDRGDDPDHLPRAARGGQQRAAPPADRARNPRRRRDHRRARVADGAHHEQPRPDVLGHDRAPRRRGASTSRTRSPARSTRSASGDACSTSCSTSRTTWQPGTRSRVARCSSVASTPGDYYNRVPLRARDRWHAPPPRRLDRSTTCADQLDALAGRVATRDRCRSSSRGSTASPRRTRSIAGERIAQSVRIANARDDRRDDGPGGQPGHRQRRRTSSARPAFRRCTTACNYATAHSDCGAALRARAGSRRRRLRADLGVLPRRRRGPRRRRPRQPRRDRAGRRPGRAHARRARGAEPPAPRRSSCRWPRSRPIRSCWWRATGSASATATAAGTSTACRACSSRASATATRGSSTPPRSRRDASPFMRRCTRRTCRRSSSPTGCWSSRRAATAWRS